MSRYLSRRTLLQGTTAAAASLALPGAAHAATRQDVQSGGLGLTRAEIEAIYGQGQPGQSYMVYTDPMFGAELHIGYEEDVADYMWLSLGNEQDWTGTLLEDAWYLVATLLPADARLRESYVMQETPGSMGQTEIVRFTSRLLDDVLGDRSSILASITSYPLEQGQVAMRGWIAVEQR